jgi:DNA-binding LacI/PurR family transcriptional regulator/DNA-binding transcriptional regulator YhcF (GntR family)
MAIQKRGLAAAVDHVRRLIRNNASGRGERLPAIAAMAAACGVGPVSMHRAVHVLQAAGLVRVVPGGGVFADDTGVPAGFRLCDWHGPVRQVRHCAWRRVRDRLAADLLGGRYGHEQPLPPLKELRRACGVSHATLRRALAALVDEGKLVSFGRGYRRGRPQVRRSANATLVVVAATDNMDMLIGCTTRSGDLWRSLERQCERLAIGLRVISFAKALGTEEYGDGRTRTLAQLQRRQSVLGYVMLAMGAPLAQLLPLLAHSGKPVAVLDEVGTVPLPLVRPLAAVRLFPVGCDSAAGQQIGNYLAGLGHRSVAVLAAEADAGIIGSRLDGLAAALAPAGRLLRFHLRGRPERAGGVRFDRGELLAARVEEGVARLHPLVNSYGRHRLVERASYLLSDHRVAERMVGLFEQALGQPDVTAWVGYNDRAALMAMQFLAGRGVSVPRRISVVGFDDTIEALGSGLTSLNPNMSAVVDAMLDHVLGWKPGRRSEGEGAAVVVPGIIIARASSAPATSPLSHQSRAGAHTHPAPSGLPSRAPGGTIPARS